jgi:WD40 repeat protein
MFIVDFAGNKSGISGVRDGLYGQAVLVEKDPVSLVLRVRGQQVTVNANDSEIYNKASSQPLPGVPSAWKLPGTTTAFVGSNKAKFQIHGWWLLPPSPAEQPATIAASGFSAASGVAGIGPGPRPVIPDRPSVFTRPVTGFSNPAGSPDGKSYDVKEVLKISDLGWGVHSLAFSPDSKYLAAGKADDAVQVFDVATGTKVAEHADLRDVGDVKCISFTPQGDKILAGGYKGKVAVWEFTATRSLKPNRPFLGHSEELAALRISKDGKFVLSGGRDKRVRYWDLATAKESAAFALEEAVLDVAFSPDGKTGYACDRKQVYQLDLTSGEIKGQSPLTSSASAAELSPDGLIVASADSYKVRIGGVADRKDLGTFDTGQMIFGFAFSPDARRVFSGSYGKVNVFDLKTSQPLGMFPVGQVVNVDTIAVSSDGRLVAAVPSAAGQTIQIFELPRP